MNNSYRVTVKVRNANLIRAIEEKGHKIGRDFCQEAGIPYVFLNALINLKTKPVDNDGNWKSPVINLCVFLNTMPCKLFDEDQAEMVLIKNTSEFELSGLQIKQLSSDCFNLQNVVDIVLSEKLTDREMQILISRFGIDGSEKTYLEIAAEHNFSPAYAREVVLRSLRKLRKSKELEQFHVNPNDPRRAA